MKKLLWFPALIVWMFIALATIAVLLPMQAWLGQKDWIDRTAEFFLNKPFDFINKKAGYDL